MDNTAQILRLAEEKILLVRNSQELQQFKVEFLGKQGIVTAELKKLAALNESERKDFGIKINSLKEEIQNIIKTKQDVLEEEELNQKLTSDKIDLSIPARKYKQGSIHPITQVTEELMQVFSKFGFSIEDGPTIETDFYNFTALNFEDDHPARQMHDTFYLKGQEEDGKHLLLRTHTSTVEIRTMKKRPLPFRIIAPGRTYRSDSDITHTPMFHQIEGLIIDKNIHMGHLKYVITEFIKSFFENADIELRFRPSFFPFTEPSVEVDIRMQKNDKWLEVLGCGMVHPNVLKNVGIDSNIYRGFAFGLGVERFAMLKYNIKDLRQFFEGDLRWLKHYNFSSFDIPNLAAGLTK
ncbi:phenylalanine--tRNA ligase subunit alpha [Rickettsia endosymbiont of Polydrusus tereticollis]|uniref:phenylalanine--tRNA ligase subunit alpha n=1 Tax=Rickettsia endosymbiont of Polydrusus tereticollis TaxID=3066251 RepID=UPI0031331BB6